MSRKHPTKPGLYWAGLDDGNGNVEVALLRVGYFHGLNSFDDGVVIEFVDGSGRTAELGEITDVMMRPFSQGSVAFIPVTYDHQEVKITWHGLAKPPASARKQMPETDL